MFKPLADPEFFAEVRVDPECGTITRPNGVDMAPEPLYAEARRHPVAQPASAPDGRRGGAYGDGQPDGGLVAGVPAPTRSRRHSSRETSCSRWPRSSRAWATAANSS